MSLQDGSDADLIKYSLELEDWLKAEKKRYEERIKPHEDMIEAIDNELQRRFNERGATNSKTDYGTAYESTIMSPTIADKGAFVTWAVHHGLIQEQTIKPLKETVKTYMDENNGEAPPGLNIAWIKKINIRRS